jgi:tRNA (mo5U34)-methyltransferase
MDSAELQAKVDGISWYHTIDLGGGVVTPGVSRTPVPKDALPDFNDRTVLDIGAWDGYYSFLAERSGATRVVALDHYMWQLDFPARQAYWEECARQGVIPDPRRDREFLTRDDLPGRRGFDLARDALNSRVEPVVGDFMSMELDELGSFDVVLFFGVLYHLPEPFEALQRLRRVTRRVAVIETEAVQIVGRESEPLFLFLPGDEMNQDHTNWNAVSEAGLHAMCRAAGFRRMVTRVGARGATPIARARRLVRDAASRFGGLPKTRHYRIVLHAGVEE